MHFLESYIRDLEQLVNIDSGTSNSIGVTKVAEIMKTKFESIGFYSELVDFGPNIGKGLFATNKPQAKEYDALLNAHMDTVFPNGTAAQRAFSLSLDKAKGFGPGCSDCKGGVLLIFYILKNLKKEELERLSIGVALNPEEETGSATSSKWLINLAGKSKKVLVFEPARPNGELVRSRKGCATYEIAFKGASSHAGNAPHDGANANLAAMRFGLAANGLGDFKFGTAVTPGIISGGTAYNVISDNCKLILDVRYWSPEQEAYLDESLKKMAEGVWSPRVTQTIKRTGYFPAMFFSEKTEEFDKLLEKAAQDVDFKVKWIDAGGASDGNHMAEANIPIIDGCGPSGGCLHSADEYIDLNSVPAKIRTITRLLSLI